MVCGSRNGIVIGEFTNIVLWKTFDLLLQASNLIMIMIMIQVSNLIMMSLLPALVLTTFNYLIYKKISRFQMRPPILKRKNEQFLKKTFSAWTRLTIEWPAGIDGRKYAIRKEEKSVFFLKLICPRKVHTALGWSLSLQIDPICHQLHCTSSIFIAEKLSD